MNTNSLKVFLGSIAFLFLMGLTSTVFAQSLRYTPTRVNTYKCLTLKGQPTTVVDTARGRISLIVWQSGFFSSGGWTPERRCQEVSNRLQNYENTRNLRYISTGTLNGYNIICVAEKREATDRENSYRCQNNGLILTLENKDDPNQVMRELFNLAARAGGGPITRGGKPTKVMIDLEEFLDKAEPIENVSISPDSKNTTESVPPAIIPPTPENQIKKPNGSSKTYLDLCSEGNQICSGN
jgi:hypothetical protein